MNVASSGMRALVTSAAIGLMLAFTPPAIATPQVPEGTETIGASLKLEADPAVVNVTRDMDATEVSLLAETLGESDAAIRSRFFGQKEFMAAVTEATLRAPEAFFSSEWIPGVAEGFAYNATVLFSQPVDDSVLQLFRHLPVNVLVRFDAPASESVVEETRAKAMALIYAEGDVVGLTGDIDPASGAIEIRYELADGSRRTPSDVAARIQHVSKESPVAISVTSADGLAPEEQVVRGGQALGGCTVGFSATRGTTKGAMTAGHCGNTTTTKPAGSAYALVYVLQHIGSYGDSQYHKSVDTVENKIKVNATGIGTFVSITSRGASANGNAVCNFGKTRVIAQCTTIRNWNHAFYDTGGVYLSRMAQSNASFTNQGDSGGPWYYSSTAIGIHYGISGGYSTYSRIFDVESILGATVKTS